MYSTVCRQIRSQLCVPVMGVVYEMRWFWVN
uniref:Uncharacterized protein n=1 Tax=Zea mays TaxID=4577 RepID=B4FHU2_MAIZE|nr:unknown [Zea mays]